jgi:ABC-type transport system substrate-binding protein
VLSIASVLGRSFEDKDLQTLAEDRGDLEESLDRLIAEGLLEEERESRGDRFAFTSGMVRDVLYAAFPRRKRRGLHRKYAEILEKRYAGRLERVYPELLHHFTEGDVPEKRVAYGLKLARKSIDSFGADEALRVLRATIDVLEDAEDDKAAEGEARALLARAHRMAGDVGAALDESEKALETLSEAGDAPRALETLLFAAETAWQARRVEETRRWVERGIDAARRVGDVDAQRTLLSLAATVANMRGEYARAAAYLQEIERLGGQAKEQAEVPPGGHLVVAVGNPLEAKEPAETQIDEEAEVLANVFETLVAADERGNPVPALADRWSLLDGGRTVRLHLRKDVRFSDGTPLTAHVVKEALTRSLRLRHDDAPAALAAIRGASEVLDGSSPELGGLEIVADDVLDVRLGGPLPIFPALLTDRTVAVAHASGEAIVGTGPFVIASHAPERVVLERNPLFHGSPARVDAVEFRAKMSPAAIAAGMRSGEIDVGRDLSPQDLDVLLRETRFRSGLVEAPKKNTYFVLVNVTKEPVANGSLRRALAGVVKTRDLVWSALGRFGLPATGLIPPGILGHDPGRRRAPLAREKAAELVRASGLATPVVLHAAVHPFFHERYRALTTALLETWSEIGIEVSIDTQTMAEYLDSLRNAAPFDLRIGRWNADYDDPDTFTYSLFDGNVGIVRNYGSSPQRDALLAEARAESRPLVREGLYRRFENELLDEGCVVPLFHDVELRIANPSVRGLRLISVAPYVNYAELGKAHTPAAEPAPAAAPALFGGVLHVPFTGSLEALDPAHASTLEQAEVVPNLFETLTRVEGGHVVPWLASEVSAESGGTEFRFRLRRGIRFHDGRSLTARDVRASFERVLQTQDTDQQWALAPIRGARRVIARETGDLAGFHVLSPLEFLVELEKPMSFFPVLVATPAASVLPEGIGELGRSWRTGCVGTGPFRLLDFEPGRRIELERNPSYWRDGVPRAEGLVFHLGVPPEEIKREFVAGRFAIAADLLPADAEALRHDPHFGPGYRESPRLITYVLAFNVNSGPFRDAAVRRAVRDSLDVPTLVRRTLGRLAVPAHGLIPPGLLGHAAVSPQEKRSGASAPDETLSRDTVAATAVVHPVFLGEYAALERELATALREMGFALKHVTRTMAEFIQAVRRHDPPSLFLGRWDADYPDADSFVRGVLHTEEGILGRFCGRPELDELSERGRAETEPRDRHAIYRQVEEILAREALLVPLFHEQSYRFGRPELEGLRVGFASPTVAYEKLSLRR